MNLHELPGYSGKKIALTLLHELERVAEGRGSRQMQDIRAVLAGVDGARLGEAETTIRQFVTEVPSAELALDLVLGARALAGGKL